MVYPGPEEHTEEQIITTVQARQGREDTGYVRYVLFASLALAVVAGIVLYIVLIK